MRQRLPGKTSLSLLGESDLPSDSPSASHSQPDRLPEHTLYRDTGCSIQPSCLSCPLPRCRFDDSQYRSTKKQPRNDIIIALHELGLRASQIATSFGLETRQVQRIIKSHRGTS